MPKVDVELVAEVLKHNEVDPKLLHQIMEEIAAEMKKEEQLAEAERVPPVKKQFVIMLSDPQGEVVQEDLVGWVVQIPENDSPMTVPERIIKSAYQFNASRKGRKYPVKSIGEACEVVGTKFQKEHHVSIKTKLPVSIIKTDNVLPQEKVKLADLRRD